MSNDQISAALEKHCRFLAYVRVNALLHDCDKSFADFLLWSLLPKERRSEVRNYNEHNKSDVLGKASVKRKEYLQYWQNAVIKTAEDLNDTATIPFPSPCYYLSYRYTIKEK
jgi:hypothetical protein